MAIKKKSTVSSAIGTTFPTGSPTGIIASNHRAFLDDEVDSAIYGKQFIIGRELESSLTQWYRLGETLTPANFEAQITVQVIGNNSNGNTTAVLAVSLRDSNVFTTTTASADIKLLSSSYSNINNVTGCRIVALSASTHPAYAIEIELSGILAVSGSVSVNIVDSSLVEDNVITFNPDEDMTAVDVATTFDILRNASPLLVVSMVGPTVIQVETERDFAGTTGEDIELDGTQIYEILGRVELSTSVNINTNGARFIGDGTIHSAIVGDTTNTFMDTNGGSIRANGVSFVQTSTGDTLNIDMGSSPTAAAVFDRCGFGKGNVNLVSGVAISCERVSFTAGAQIIQTASAGLSNISISNQSSFSDFNSMENQPEIVDGFIVFETLCNPVSVTLRSILMVYTHGTANNKGIRIDDGANVTVLGASVINSQNINVGAGQPESIFLQIANPNDVSFGEIEEVVVTGTGAVFAECNPSTPTSSTATETQTRGIGTAFNNDSFTTPKDLITVGGNLTSTANLYRFPGLTATTPSSTLSLTTIGDEPRSCMHFMGVPWITDSDDTTPEGGTGLYRLTSYSDITEIDDYDFGAMTLAASGITTMADGTIRGVTTDGQNLIVSSLDRIYITQGLGEVVFAEIDMSSISTSISDIDYDGRNLSIVDSDNGEIVIMEGISNIERYRVPLTDVIGITSTISAGATVGGQAVAKEDFCAMTQSSTPTSTLEVYGQSIDFDHGSPTWEFSNTLGAYQNSRDNFCIRNFPTGYRAAITVTRDFDTGDAGRNVWADIVKADPVVDFYAMLPNSEAFLLINEETGEFVYIGTREKILSVAINVFAAGQGGSVNMIETGYALNSGTTTDNLPNDSKTACTVSAGELNNTTNANITSANSLLKIQFGDRLHAQYQNLSVADGISPLDIKMAGSD